MMSQITKNICTRLLWRGKSILCAIKSAILSVAKCVVALVLSLVTSATAFASSTGAGGFTKATTEISSYQTPVSNLMKAIAAVIVLVGAFNVFFKLRASVEGVCQMPL